MEPRPDVPGSFDVVTTSLTYQLLIGDRKTQFDEVLTYHWTPNVPGAKRTWPHLHIGSMVVSSEMRRDPWAFHKTHIATGALSAEGFVTMAVEEFGVLPIVPDWDARINE